MIFLIIVPLSGKNGAIFSRLPYDGVMHKYTKFSVDKLFLRYGLCPCRHIYNLLCMRTQGKAGYVFF